MKKLSEAPTIHPGAKVSGGHLGRWTEVGEGARLLDTTLGDYSYCERFSDLAYAEVGRFANIAAFVRIGPTNHPMHRASLHHFMYRAAAYWDDAEDEAEFFEWRRAQGPKVGHDTWFGHQSVVLPGVTVGTGAVVGAGAVVSKDVGPYEIVAGVPAKPIRRRFAPEIAERLLALAWWEWDHAALRTALTDFRELSVEAFLEKHGG
ncbi:hypothetical protein [Oceanicella sp. SM1341]|uniref:hypothetical protein n=1 Tax=Oceanicella sp. SM1341 TaxID=1548889 RepID=UPI000E537502|nr:hypothetical protein [Oceanicella sp. SM1341]